MFSRKVISNLKYYVYAYYDPRNRSCFYIGKGCGNRAFSHLNDKTESVKTQTIAAIRKAGLEPQIRILRHGLIEKEAKLIEAVAIDLLGIDSLSNLVQGYKSNKLGSMSVDKLENLYNARKAVIKEQAILINIPKSYREDMTEQEMYDYTRSCWKVGTNKDKIKYAFSVFQGIIMEVYKISAWVQGGSTLRINPIEPNDRWEFVGRPAEEIRKKYIGKSASHYFNKSQNPLKYVNL
jgi:hypothetical protein